jgi:eukaryotic-like serine/threonine-protein kinase
MSPLDRLRWQRVEPILDEVFDLPAGDRRRRLETVLADDPELRAELLALLDADARHGGVLDGDSRAFVEEALRAFAGAPEHRMLPGVHVAGRYRIVSLLGRGGMGEVYRADDLRLGQAVALKFPPRHLQENPAYLQRLLNEARLARQVSHPNVCRVYDIGEWEGRQFISMEYIDGEDLASLLTRIGYLPPQKAVDIARQLCAGLHPAHQLGILHCDLKPSNVMLDGRGQVRITDFGLAVAAADLPGHASRAGTPAYMSPEQLEGREATPRSDIYALGLVLYELFTGRRAFQAGSVDELRRMQDESSPTPPSRLIEGFDAAVERAILRCLERDPSLRPASAREVAGLLPGGDPLADAIAAGETPSPEAVAASGPEGALNPAQALTLLGAIVLMLVVLLVLNDRASVLGWVPMARSAAALEDNARLILARLGYRESARDRIWGFSAANPQYRNYVRRTNQSPDRWDPLRHPAQLDVMFFYRQAPFYLKPFAWHGFANLNDPPPAPGDVVMGTDLRGRLFWLSAVPEAATTPGEAAAAPDWRLLFEQAGLDITRFTPAAPTRNAATGADVRAAWSGALPDFAGYPVRVEAAALQGRPVFFELVVPWDPYWDPLRQNASDVPSDIVLYSYPLFMALFLLFAFAAGAVLVVRNWLSGRGDRQGAFRAAVIVFCLRLALWVLAAHHVPDLALEVDLLAAALGKSLTDAAVTWVTYVALEPHLRRLHPQTLVSWTRLLRGRLTDPLVGRDILYGAAASTFVILFWAQLYVIIPHALDWPAPPPPIAHPIGSPPYMPVLDVPYGLAMLGGRHVPAAVVANVLSGFGILIMISPVQLGLRLLLRNTWAAAGVTLVIMTGLAWPLAFGGVSTITVMCSMAGALTVLGTLRWGLLGLVTIATCMGMWVRFPITTNVNAPYFGTGLVGVLLIAGIGAFGAYTASRRSRITIAI